MEMMALLPMKGHSERVPNKNMRSFAGRPLYHHVLHALISCPYIKAIHIDTDSEVIAGDARQHFGERVEIIERPPEICGDFVSMNVIINYDLSRVAGDYFLQTHSTNPLLTTNTLNRAIELFLEAREHDSLFSVTRLQSRLYDKGARAINHNPNEMLRTQDLPPVYEENSNLYLFSRKSFEKCGRRIGENPILFEMSKMEAIDIDDEADFRLAEYIHQVFWCPQDVEKK